MQVGAQYLDNKRCRFTVWAPTKERITLHLISSPKRLVEMKKDEEGYFQVIVNNIIPGTNYYYQIEDGPDLPDPASYYQADGVHGPSQVIDHNAYQWKTKDWKGLNFKDLILYELHVGTFTPEGTFKAILPRLDELKEMGINALEIMPISQFPGTRNWGYDGVYPYSVQNSYGTPDDFKQLVDECHLRGIAVFLDLVYNHLGPEGNYFGHYGPYFTKNYCTPWGDAINFDGAYSDGVRDFFSDNALFWAEIYHLDGLRLDAIHTVYDMGAVHFWEYTQEKLQRFRQQTGRKYHLIAESDLNSPRVVQSPALGGYGFDAAWLDDFHHALYVILHERGRKRYEDFGSIKQLAKAIKEGYVHSGEYVEFRKKKYGRSSAGISGDHFVVFTHNHDQIGNHPRGQRWGGLVDLERLKLGAALMLLAPYIPMLFMGEEYGEDNPYYYFVSHTDQELVRAVQKGRREEFANFDWASDPPDPQSEETFEASKINWDKRNQGKYALIREWYKKLIHLRKQARALQNFDKDQTEVTIHDEKCLILQRNSGTNAIVCLFNFSNNALEINYKSSFKSWRKILDSTDFQLSGRKQLEAKDEVTKSYFLTEERIQIKPTSVLVYECN